MTSVGMLIQAPVWTKLKKKVFWLQLELLEDIQSTAEVRLSKALNHQMLTYCPAKRGTHSAKCTVSLYFMQAFTNKQFVCACW